MLYHICISRDFGAKFTVSFHSLAILHVKCDMIFEILFTCKWQIIHSIYHTCDCMMDLFYIIEMLPNKHISAFQKNFISGIALNCLI